MVFKKNLKKCTEPKVVSPANKDSQCEKWSHSKDQIKGVAISPFIQHSGRWKTMHYRHFQHNRRAPKNLRAPQPQPKTEEGLLQKSWWVWPLPKGAGNNLIHRKLTTFLKGMYQFLLN